MLMNAREDAQKVQIMASALPPRICLRCLRSFEVINLKSFQTGKKNPSMMREGGFYSREDENPFKDFVKVYQPYCTSDIHQGIDSYYMASYGNEFVT